MSFDSTTQLPTPGGTPRFQDQDESTPASYAHHSTTWTPIDSMTPISTNPSRKRSRDGSAFDSEPDGSYFPSATTPAPIPEEPVYGEGMMLLNPRTGVSISAESQTGTWYEEKEDEAPPQLPEFRPIMPSSRKSIRLSQSSVRAMPDDLVAAPASPPKGPHPEVDEATLALGIGWTRMSPDVDMQAAARGWARYLENHYARHIHGAEILLKSTGLNAYLVGCQEGFFLFSENLLEGQLVARTWEACLLNLRSQPISFEGPEVLRAERTPGPEAKDNATEMMRNWADYDRLNGPGPTSNGDMDLD